MVRNKKASNKRCCEAPDFSIVVPHLKGKDNLFRCIKSIYDMTDENFEIILVDNFSKDMSVEVIYSWYPDIVLIRTDRNLGFAGGCNAGIRISRGEYIVLLNDDTVVTKNWLKEVRRTFMKYDECAVVQPKLLSYEKKGYFEYAGSSGGYIDRFCFPFTRGRIFNTIEVDNEQYNDEEEIFWGAGAALIIRRKLFNITGLFDEDFFAHMEEIDFCFRVHGSGYKVFSVPKSVVYHKTASTLEQDNFLKMYLNHRNSLFLMIKNYPFRELIKNLLIRQLLDLSAVCYFTMIGKFKRSFAIILSYLGCVGEISCLLKKRRQMAEYFPFFPFRILPKLFKRSIALDYYLLKKRKFSDLCYSFSGVC